MAKPGEADCQVQVWLEKDALSGVLYPITSDYDVALMVSRGYSSVTFAHEAAETLVADGRTAFIYHLGDHDPSGVDAARAIEQELREHATGIELHFKRLAVLPAQIRAMRLPTRPTKLSDSGAIKFGADSVELDAIDPRTLREIVRAALAGHLPDDELAALQDEEARERAALVRWAKRRKP